MGNKKSKGGKGGDASNAKSDTGKAATTNTATNTAPKEVKSYKVLLIGDRYVTLHLHLFI